MRLGFYIKHACLFGTTASVHNYADYNQKILGNESIVFYDENDQRNNQGIIDKFAGCDIKVCPVEGDQNMSFLSEGVRKEKIDKLYIQKCGKKNDGRWVDNVPCLIHCVGCENDPHGERYAYVSEWLSDYMSKGQIPFVPYIAHLPEHENHFRAALGIPRDAIVFSRMGGYYSWNIPWVNNCIKLALDLRDDIYFLFVQTHKFIEHERVIHINPFSSLYNKRKFINTSDAFLHARNEGESFGMAVAEYSICDKPVITWSESKERNHIVTLGNKGIYYKNAEDLISILKDFEPQPNKDWNAYSEFTPEKVIKKFDQVFLK